MKKTIYSALAILTFASAALSQSVVQPGDPVIASSANGLDLKELLMQLMESQQNT